MHTDDSQARADAQFARAMRDTPGALQKLLNDPSEDAAELAARVLRGLRWLRRHENMAAPSDRQEGADR